MKKLFKNLEKSLKNPEKFFDLKILLQFKNLIQLTIIGLFQSYTNLQYRRPDRDSDEEDVERRAGQWATLDSAEVRRRKNSPDGIRTSGGLRYQRDTRPYASTNVIHETEELRTGVFDERR